MGGINYYYKAPPKAVENLSVIALPAVSGNITAENPAFVAGISTSSSDAVTTEEIVTTAAALPSSSSSSSSPPLAAAAEQLLQLPLQQRVSLIHLLPMVQNPL
jgi:hypothetical protein